MADHLWQIPENGGPEATMLEAYTRLGYLAACTSRVELLA
ncbi:LLM class flavin-dependent oxidoreductase [Pseudonocardia halophobica]|nr:LLM class flavin-dependent oxidoreductase [Pseudonocardia halophobica]